MSRASLLARAVAKATRLGDTGLLARLEAVVASDDGQARAQLVSLAEAAAALVPRPTDGHSPDPEALAKAAAALVPRPTDGHSPDPEAVAEAAAALVPRPADGHSPDPEALAKAAAALVPRPADGHSPDPEALAKAAAALVPRPADGHSPDPEALAKAAAALVPRPADGHSPDPEALAKAAAALVPRPADAVTDVRLEDNELAVYRGIARVVSGVVTFPRVSLYAQGGGGGRRPAATPTTTALANPAFTYSDDGVLSRVDYEGGATKTFNYTGGVLGTVALLRDDVTTTQTFNYGDDGALLSVTRS